MRGDPGLWCGTALRFSRRNRLGELAIMRWVMPLHDPTRKASSGAHWLETLPHLAKAFRNLQFCLIKRNLKRLR